MFYSVRVSTYRPYLCTDYIARYSKARCLWVHLSVHPHVHMHACLRATYARSRSGLPHDAVLIIQVNEVGVGIYVGMV